MIVGDIMTPEPRSVREDTPLDIVAGLMIEHRIGCIPVVDADGGLRGIITEADFAGNERNVPFGAFVLPHLFDAQPDEEQLELVRRMVDQQRQRFPVVRTGRLVGIISRDDLLRLIAPQALPASAAEG